MKLNPACISAIFYLSSPTLNRAISMPKLALLQTQLNFSNKNPKEKDLFLLDLLLLVRMRQVESSRPQIHYSAIMMQQSQSAPPLHFTSLHSHTIRNRTKAGC